MIRTGLERSRLYFVPLTVDHRPGIEAFACGVPDLDAFLRDDALRLHEAHISFTYLAFHEHADGRDTLVGYVSLIADALTLEQDEKPDIPAIAFSVLPPSRSDASPPIRWPGRGREGSVPP